MALIGDEERERAGAWLGEHFARGRLTLEELEQRVARTLDARTSGDLRRAFRGLPGGPRPPVLHTIARGALLVAATGAWFAVTLVLLLVLLLALALDGPSFLLAVVVVAWAVPTVLLVRRWRRVLPRRA
jgi:hypothetical protein